VHSIGWAIVAVVCMYLLVRHFTSSMFLSLTAAVTLLVSNAFWVFATQLEAYAAIAGSLMLLTVALVYGVDRWPRGLYIVSCASIWAWRRSITSRMRSSSSRRRSIATAAGPSLGSHLISLYGIIIATYGVAYRLQ
jgi:chromate transport protein ChrA